MNSETLAALKASIAKWKRKATSKTIEDIDLTESCPLCDIFASGKPEMWCLDCPVYVKTGKKHCRGTPYHDVNKAVEDGDFEEAIHCCKDEVAFLKSLLPEGEKE